MWLPGAPGVMTRFSGTSGVSGSLGLENPKAYQRSLSSSRSWLSSSRNPPRRFLALLIPVSRLLLAMPASAFCWLLALAAVLIASAAAVQAAAVALRLATSWVGLAAK